MIYWNYYSYLTRKVPVHNDVTVVLCMLQTDILDIICIQYNVTTVHWGAKFTKVIQINGKQNRWQYWTLAHAEINLKYWWPHIVPLNITKTTWKRFSNTINSFAGQKHITSHKKVKDTFYILSFIQYWEDWRRGNEKWGTAKNWWKWESWKYKTVDRRFGKFRNGKCGINRYGQRQWVKNWIK